MVETNDPLVVQEQANGKYWRLQQPLTFNGQQQAFTVPQGFITDFASIPRLLTLLVPKTGKYNKAAVLHDWLWRISKASQQGLLKTNPDTGIMYMVDNSHPWPVNHTHVVDPVDVDGLFRRAMRLLDVGFCRRWLMWGAVRAAAIFSGRTGNMTALIWGQLAAIAASIIVPVAAAAGFVIGPVL